MLEVIYKYYFKLLSKHPLGALDLRIRRFLGVLFNEASTKTDLATIASLAKHRQGAIEQILKKSTIPPDQLPDIDIVITVSTSDLNLETVLKALEQQSYPGKKITLTIILLKEDLETEKPLLPARFLNARYFEIAKADASSAYTSVLKGLNAPYFMLMANPLVFGEHSLEALIQDCISSHPDTSLWEISPALVNRNHYYDPVTLELPGSNLECGIINREKFDAIGGFDEQLSISSQRLELSYRMRSNGYRLKNIGQSGLFEQLTSSSQSPKYPDNHRQQVSLTFRPSRRQGDEYEYRTGAQNLGSKVSIIIRTYAGRRYWLRESICSVLNQTHPNLELIVVEDGTTEHKEFIEKISASLKPIRTIKYLTQRKVGKSHAGNLGLENVEGDFIGFLDDDDLLFAGHVESLLALLIHKKNADGACAWAWEVQTSMEAGNTYSEEHFEVPKIAQQPFSRVALKKQNPWSIQSVLFKRELYDKHGGVDTNRSFLEDWDLWLRYTKHSLFVNLAQVTSIYRTPADPYERLKRISKPVRRTIR